MKTNTTVQKHHKHILFNNTIFPELPPIKLVTKSKTLQTASIVHR